MESEKCPEPITLCPNWLKTYFFVINLSVSGTFFTPRVRGLEKIVPIEHSVSFVWYFARNFEPSTKRPMFCSNRLACSYRIKPEHCLPRR